MDSRFTDNPARGLSLLSLDATGARGIAQLRILMEVMQRLEIETEEENMNRPCTLFDMIGGIGTGGFVAILLVTFGLTAGRALEEFIQFSGEVLEPLDLDMETRSTVLRQYIEQLLTKYDIPTAARLTDFHKRHTTCKLIVPVTYKQQLDSFVILRNFGGPSDSNMDLIIGDAIYATLAIPRLITPMKFFKDSATFDILGGSLSSVNPIRELIAEAYAVFGPTRHVANVVSFGCSKGIAVTPVNLDTDTWNDALEKVIAEGDDTDRGVDGQIGHLGLYFRFRPTHVKRLPCLTGSGSTSILVQTEQYLKDSVTSRTIDSCARSLNAQDGVLTLEQLKYHGSERITTPKFPSPTRNFVMRTEPWAAIENAIFGEIKDNDNPQRTCIVTGIAGGGKSEIMLKFIEEYGHRFSATLYIDGTSEPRIRAAILRYMRSLNADNSRMSFKEALVLLSHSPSDAPLLLLYDNVDDINLDLLPLLPRGDHVVLMITSRNHSLGELSPENHITMGAMSLDDGFELLMQSSGIAGQLTNMQRTAGVALAERLGLLPIALTQARKYMDETGCSAYDCHSMLTKDVNNLLGSPMAYNPGVRFSCTYAAFTASYDQLSDQDQRFLHLVSCFHNSPIPLHLINLAVRYNFQVYRCQYMDSAEDRSVARDILTGIFTKPGYSSATTVDQITASLQNHSLVDLTSVKDIILLQIHPLVHEWVCHRTPPEQLPTYRSAAVTLLCAGSRNPSPAPLQLPSHIFHLLSLVPDLHVNARGAFALILHDSGQPKDAYKLQEQVMQDLTAVLDGSDPSLMTARYHLATMLSALGRHPEAATLKEEVLKSRTTVLGERHEDTIEASISLAATFTELGRHSEARTIQERAHTLANDVFGNQHPTTLSAVVDLADSYARLGETEKASALLTQEFQLNLQKTFGATHSLPVRSQRILDHISASRPQDVSISSVVAAGKAVPRGDARQISAANNPKKRTRFSNRIRSIFM